jgi:hypothetical protein
MQRRHLKEARCKGADYAYVAKEDINGGLLPKLNRSEKLNIKRW